MANKLGVASKVFGLYLIFLSLLAFANAFAHPEIASPLWFCYIAVLLIGLGLFYRKSDIVAMQVNIMAIPVLVWNIDFYHYLITGKTLWGITDYFFFSKDRLSNFITLQHLYVIPITLVFLYFFGSYKKDLWKYSFIEAIGIFALSWFFTNQSANVNCVFKSCINFLNITGIFYQIFWFAAMVLMVFLTNSLFSYLMDKIKKR
ncbi:MAG: hypothetical protein ABSG05_03005 [Candidatus Pacearchaeota archaeon]|jgi:hypothetical protein